MLMWLVRKQSDIRESKHQTGNLETCMAQNSQNNVHNNMHGAIGRVMRKNAA